MKKIVLAIAAASCVLLGGAAAASAQTALSNGFRGEHGWAGAATGAADFVYGANRVPYGWNEDNPRDFQLQGTH
jgi:hypothetical protein